MITRVGSSAEAHNSADGGVGLRVVQTLEGIYTSAATGQPWDVAAAANAHAGDSLITHTLTLHFTMRGTGYSTNAAEHVRSGVTLAPSCECRRRGACASPRVRGRAGPGIHVAHTHNDTRTCALEPCTCSRFQCFLSGCQRISKSTEGICKVIILL
jgi:hypothetical protein